MEEGRAVADKKATKNEVVLRISDTDEAMYGKKEQGDCRSFPVSESTSISPQNNTQMGKGFRDLRATLTELENVRNKGQVSSESVTMASTRRLMGRSEFSKPKSRMVEPPHPKDANFVEGKGQMTSPNSSTRNSPNKSVAVISPRDAIVLEATTIVTPRTPLLGNPGEEEDEDEEVYKTANIEVSRRSGKKSRVLGFVEWFAFVCLVGFFVATLTVHKLQQRTIWGLELWKWCVLVLVILCGRLVTEWFINILVFLTERNFLFKKRVLYFVYGVKSSVQAFIWLGLVLLTWCLLFNHGVKRTRRVTRILNYITRTLGSCLIGAAIWLVKQLSIKLLASKFQSTRFFDRVQESIFHQYILRVLSGPPLMEMAEKVGNTSSSGRLSFKTMTNENEGEKEQVIDVEKLKKMKQEKVSASTMKGLINVIRSYGLSTMTYSPNSADEDEIDQKDYEITSEWEAKAAAYQIFRNVAKQGNKYIEMDDLLRFMKKEEVENVLPLFEGGVATGRIKRKSLKNWLVKVYLERRSLVHSLNDTNTAVDDLNKLASVIVLIVIIIVWLLIMDFLTTQVLLFISSQLLLVVFVFGNTAKTVFEAIIFIFVMHPFDVGDRCVIDDVQMIVEEMNILTTVFLKSDNEKIFYPNSVLATKPISNFYRSPEMSDSVEFAVDISTSIESIGALKAKLKAYLESKPQHWRPNLSITVKDIENVNKMKMSLSVDHTINFQNYGDKSSRRSDLVLELKKSLEELNIKYHLLPQEVHLSYVRS